MSTAEKPAFPTEQPAALAEKPTPSADAAPANFLNEIVEEDQKNGRWGGRLLTRFPPEPNGYLHIGHAKSICLNFGLARDHGGQCNLRFDDTNPTKEEVEYVDAIMNDVRWLGFDWGDHLFYASDYFEKLYDFAVQLIREGLAYVDSLTLDQVREYRGSFYVKGQDSPYRTRSVEENLDLFLRMRAGEFPDGAHLLRAKIDMASQNMNLRDPPMYRIRHAHHHRTGDTWCIYPTYDFAHGQSDAIEGVTHSICTLEFENHQPLYDWFLEALRLDASRRPQQIEFAMLNLSYTVLGKRKLLELVQEGKVNGWSDPRMPTLSGMRRRGYTAQAIRAFCERIGVARKDGVVDLTLLEHAIREDLNANSPRVMGVLHPLRVVIENLPEGQVEEFDAPYFPEGAERGSRKVPFGRVIYVEQEDFREDAPKKWFRLGPGREVRLRYACLITCKEVVKDEKTGQVIELRCVWDPASRGGNSPDGRRVNGTLHWVSAAHAVPAEVRLYDRLWVKEDPLGDKDGKDWKEHLNPASLSRLTGCLVEPSLLSAAPGSRWQFERLGYFCVDSEDSGEGRLVFNRTVSLKDSWAKLEKTEAKK